MVLLAPGIAPRLLLFIFIFRFLLLQFYLFLFGLLLLQGGSSVLQRLLQIAHDCRLAIVSPPTTTTTSTLRIHATTKLIEDGDVGDALLTIEQHRVCRLLL